MSEVNRKGLTGTVWVHGELLDKNNIVEQFRYTKVGTIGDTIHTIETRYLPDSQVLWIEEGFVPENKERWLEWWAMEKPNE